jgi:hypothetical protein
MAFHPDRLRAACRRSLIRRKCSGLQQPYYRAIIVQRCFTALALVLQRLSLKKLKAPCGTAWEATAGGPFRFPTFPFRVLTTSSTIFCDGVFFAMSSRR